MPADSICPDSCQDRCGRAVSALTANECHCDHLCWLYGDCCVDYYSHCLHIHANASDEKILTATLAALQNYSQLLQFREDFYWSDLSRCFNLSNIFSKKYFQIVSSCGSEKEMLTKFEAVHRDLQDPLSNNTKYFIGLSQDEIKQRCEKNDLVYSNQHILDQTHVTLTRDTTVHFVNVFCAICNGVKPSQVSLWTTNVTCDSQTFNQTGNILLFTGNFDHDMINNNCTIHNIANARHRFRSCFPYKHYASHYIEFLRERSNGSPGSYGNSFCCEPNSGLSYSLCKRYQFPYVDITTNTIYKNHDCFTCSASSSTLSPFNELNDNLTEISITNSVTLCGVQYKCDCLQYLNFLLNNFKIVIPYLGFDEHKTIVRPTSLSYRILLDFQSGQTTVTVNETIMIIETKSCPQGQVYAPLLDSCRQVNCVPGARWQDNRCVPVNHCPEMGSEINETYQSDSQILNYSYLPFPDGSVYLSLSVALWYIFGPVGATASVTRADRDKEKIDQIYDIPCLHTSKDQASQKASTENKTKNSQNGCDGKCVVFSRSLSHLFKLSNLKRMWVEQIQNKKSTKLNQTDYNKTMTKVRKRINSIVNSHVVNKSLNVKTIYCSGSTCLTADVPLLQNNTFSYKQPTHNPCLENPIRPSKSRKKKPISDECLSFGIHLKSSANLDVILKAVKVMTNDIATVAHDNNFLVSRLQLTNSLHDKSGQSTREAERQTNVGIDERLIASSGQPCPSGELVTFNETNVELSLNGTYVVHFNGQEIPLGTFLFNVELDINPTTSESEVKVANISWCQTDFSKLRCESLQMTMYDSSNSVFVNGTLVLTNMAATFTQFLGNDSTRMATLDELVSIFPKRFVGGNATIVKGGQYIETRRGVLVCSNFSNTYSNETKTIHTFKKSVFVPDSEAEIIATYLSSVISITCLTSTLVVYSFMPSLQNVPGKIVMSLSAALLCAHILFLCCQKPEGLACEIYSAVHHAVWLSSFAWLTALSVNLAYILNCQSSHCDTSRSNIFKLLSVVCWGVPFMFCVICFVLFKTNFVSIGYGQDGVCWIGNMQSLLLTFGVPVFLIIAVTSVCAVSVVKAIGSSLSFRSKSTASRRKSRQQIIVCVNLSLLTSFNWLFYFLAVGVNNTVLWTLHSLINGSQGLYIFLCFIARKSLLLKFVTNLKLVNMWSRKCDHSCESSKAKMAATITTPQSSPRSSINLKYLNNQTKQAGLNVKA